MRTIIVLNKYGLKAPNECRGHFNKWGLTYDDITEGDIQALYLLCIKYVKIHVKAGGMSVNSMYMSKKLNIKKKRNGYIQSAFMYLNSHYFTQREAISFNADGFIGFAGWADSGNTQPLLDAFVEWCDWLADCKNEINGEVQEVEKKNEWNW